MTDSDLDELENFLEDKLDTQALTFGKFKGRTPDWIMRNEPSYLVWAYENTDHTVCSKELYEEALEDVQQQHESASMSVSHSPIDFFDY